MGEALYYDATLFQAICDIAKALKVKENGNILLDSEITGLSTYGVGGWDDTFATGIRGT